MRSEDGFAVGGAREPGEAEANAVGPTVPTASVSCVERLDGVGDGRRGNRGFSGARADLGGYDKTRSESVIGCRQSPRAAGTAIDGGDRGRNTGDETPRMSRNVVNPHTWPVCAKIAKIGGGERDPTQDSTFSAGY